MSYLYLDPFSGLSGNMLLGVLFDLGLDYDQFQVELQKLHVSGYHLTLEKKQIDLQLVVICLMWCWKRPIITRMKG